MANRYIGRYYHSVIDHYELRTGHLEDKKGDAAVLLPAEKDMNTEIKNDETRHVGNDCTTSIDNDETIEVGNDRTAVIGNDDTLNVGTNLIIEAGSQITIKTGAASITMMSSGEITIEGLDVTVKGSAKVLVDGGGQLDEKAAMINIQGGLVKIN